MADNKPRWRNGDNKIYLDKTQGVFIQPATNGSYNKTYLAIEWALSEDGDVVPCVYTFDGDTDEDALRNMLIWLGQWFGKPEDRYGNHNIDVSFDRAGSKASTDPDRLHKRWLQQNMDCYFSNMEYRLKEQGMSEDAVEKVLQVIRETMFSDSGEQ